MIVKGCFNIMFYKVTKHVCRSRHENFSWHLKETSYGKYKWNNSTYRTAHVLLRFAHRLLDITQKNCSLWQQGHQQCHHHPYHHYHCIENSGESSDMFIPYLWKGHFIFNFCHFWQVRQHRIERALLRKYGKMKKLLARRSLALHCSCIVFLSGVSSPKLRYDTRSYSAKMAAW